MGGRPVEHDQRALRHFSFLEDTGYLARVAYLMDSFLSGLGIDGKSAIPLMMGFLCNTVSIAGSRVVDSPRRRLITLCMLPFIPCSGQMGVAFLFAFALFPCGYGPARSARRELP